MLLVLLLSIRDISVKDILVYVSPVDNKTTARAAMKHLVSVPHRSSLCSCISHVASIYDLAGNFTEMP